MIKKTKTISASTAKTAIQQNNDKIKIRDNNKHKDPKKENNKNVEHIPRKRRKTKIPRL